MFKSIHWQQRKICRINQYISSDDNENANSNASRNIFILILYLSADVTNGCPALVSPKCRQHTCKYRAECNRCIICCLHFKHLANVRLRAGKAKNDNSQNTCKNQDQNRCTESCTDLYAFAIKPCKQKNK